MPYNVNAFVQFHFPHSPDVPITDFAESAFKVPARRAFKEPIREVDHPLEFRSHVTAA
jgi:hypothetical protein